MVGNSHDDKVYHRVIIVGKMLGSKTTRKCRRGGELSRARDQILEESEEVALLQRIGSAPSCRCNGHRTDNVLVSHLRKLRVVVEAWDTDLFAGLKMRLGQSESHTILGAELVEHGLVLTSPFIIDTLPFLPGKLVDVGGDAVVFASAHKVLGKVAARNIPVRTQLVEMIDIAHHGLVGLGLDREIRMAQLVGPFIVGIRQYEWGRGRVARDRAGSTGTRATNRGNGWLG